MTAGPVTSGNSAAAPGRPRRPSAEDMTYYCSKGSSCRLGGRGRPGAGESPGEQRREGPPTMEAICATLFPASAWALHGASASPAWTQRLAASEAGTEGSTIGPSTMLNSSSPHQGKNYHSFGRSRATLCPVFRSSGCTVSPGRFVLAGLQAARGGETMRPRCETRCIEESK